MEFEADIKQFGGSDGTFFVNIPKRLVQTEKLGKGEKILVNIKKSEIQGDLEKFRCLDCNSEVYTTGTGNFCTVCGRRCLETEEKFLYLNLSDEEFEDE